MKNLVMSLAVVAVLLPAAQVRDNETQRGKHEMINTLVGNIDKASENNKSHTWLNTHGYNLAQRYEMQKDVQSKGYVIDVPLFGSTYIGW